MLLLFVKTLLKISGEMYSIQYYVIKFVNDLRQVVVKTDRHDITEIVLKVALDTITLTLKFQTH